MNVSDTNNHFSLKAFLLFVVVFTFSTATDFKFLNSTEVGNDVVLCTKLKQQTNAIQISLPKLPPFRVNYSFGLENDFFFRNVEIAQRIHTSKHIKNELKQLISKHLDFKNELDFQAFSSTQLSRSIIPGYYLA